MKVWTATAQLVCTPSSQFLYTQNCCQPLSTRVPFSVPLLGFKGCCQLMRLGQSYYEGLSLKTHKHVSDHFCSTNGLIKQWDFLFSSDLQARNALFQRKLMKLANHVLLHHKGQGKRKSLLEKWGASQQKARMYSVSVLFYLLMRDAGPTLDRLTYAFHCMQQPLSSPDWKNILCDLSLIRLSFTSSWSSRLISDRQCFLSQLEMAAKIHRIYFQSVSVTFVNSGYGNEGKIWIFMYENAFCFLWEGNKQFIFNARSFPLQSCILF